MRRSVGGGAPGDAGVPRRTASALAAALFVAALGLFAWHAARAPLFGDTCLDLAIARDCVDGAACGFFGSGSSFLWLRHGALWVHLLTAALFLGRSTYEVQWFVLVLHALAGAVLFLGAVRRLTVATSVVAAVLFLAGSVVLVQYPILWNPAIVPAFGALSFVADWRLVERRRVRDAAVAGVALALVADAHMVHWAVVPLLLFLVLVAGKRPAWCLAAAGLAFVATLAAVAHGSLWWNARELARRGLVWVPLLAVAAPVALGWWARRRGFALTEARASVLALAYGLLFCLALYAERASARLPFKPWYALPFLPLGSILLAVGLRRALMVAAAWLRRARIALSAGQLAAAASMGAALWFVDQVARTASWDGYWTVSGVEALARSLYGHGYTYWQLAAWLEAPERDLVLQCVSPFEPVFRPYDADSALPPRSLQLVRAPARDPSVQRQVPGAVVEVVPLGGGQLGYVLVAQPWLRWSAAEICIQPAPGSPARLRCEPSPFVRPPTGERITSFEQRFHSQHVAVAQLASSLGVDASARSDIVLRVPVHLDGSDAVHRLWVLERGAPWRIDGLVGPSHRFVVPGAVVDLVRGHDSDGQLTLRPSAAHRPSISPAGLLRSPSYVETSQVELWQRLLPRTRRHR